MEKNKKKTGIEEWWYNITHIKKNITKVKASPYATLAFSLKVRKMILIPLIAFIIFRGYDMIVNFRGSGIMGLFQKAVMLGIFIYLIYRIYATIPAAKKQLEYYRKYPHTINYCPTNVKEDVNEILEKIEKNKKNLEEKQKREAEIKNVRKSKSTKKTSGKKA